MEKIIFKEEVIFDDEKINKIIDDRPTVEKSKKIIKKLYDNYMSKVQGTI